MGVFSAALGEMARRGASTWESGSFKKYAELTGQAGRQTWQHISVDAIDRLSPELRDTGTMVFRLGSRAGESSTHFGLAKCLNGWADYFLLDDKLFAQASPQVFLPAVSSRRLFAFQLLPKLTETSIVNLAIGSGLLQHTMGLDDSTDLCVPATGQSTFTFTFRPHRDLSGRWTHENGQVEIDALLVGRRNAREQLFLVEAKTGKPNGSLAKHKLCYPLAALRRFVPEHIDIVPIYLKSWAEKDGRHFLITECTCSSDGEIAISSLEPVRVTHGVLHGFGSD